MTDSASSGKTRASKPGKVRPKLRDGVMKRGNTWSYVIRVTDPETGISKPKWVGGFRTEDDAKEARDEARVKARRGEYIDRNAISVADYLDEWLDAHAVEIKPKTLANYRYLIDRHVKPNIGGLRLQAVRPGQITKLYRDLVTTGGQTGKGVSPRTVAHVHSVLRKAFGDAVRVDELIASNPTERAKRPRLHHDEPGKVWTPEQLRAFLTSAEGHRLSAFFRLAAYTGARRGELLNLRWPDVDLDGATIHIRGSVSFIAGERIEGTTKSGRSRVVSLDPGTVDVLKAHRKRQLADKLKAGEFWKGTEDGHVFTTGWGEPVHPDTVSSLMAVLIKGHNGRQDVEPLPRARLHDLRHVHATTLLLAGVPVHVVAARLGHADPAITLRVYAHVVNEQLAEAATIFAGRVDGVA
ncbi:tyrosine-type recombinase/integrase [Actinomadura welshii]|uniref:tyrosine-type recombinase/integrase n=1 Tax=Actinomadura welshii TaxID=3103817 RepID=UPI0003AD4B1E|nr:tyrosine-type recombinase/integrase [Actinomadura madurae]